MKPKSIQAMTSSFPFDFPTAVLMASLSPVFLVTSLSRSLYFFESVNFFRNHIQTVCKVTLGECMKPQDIPASYLFIWMFFKLPILILLGIILFPMIETKLFREKKNK